MDYAFDIISKKSSPNPKLCRCSLMSSSRSFIVFCFIFTSVIYFEFFFFFFFKDVKSVISFSVCGYTVVSGPFVEETIFAPLYCLCYFFNDQPITYLALDSLLYSLNLSLSPIPCSLDYSSFIIWFE